MERAQVLSASEDSSRKRKRSTDLSDATDQSHGDTCKRSDETVRQESSSLCSRCSSIDVDSLFVDLEGHLMKELMTLGELGKEAELSSCALCRLFHAVRQQGSAKIENYALYCVRSPKPHQPNPTKNGTVLAVIRGKHEARLMLLKNRASCGFIACLSASRKAPSIHSLHVYSIDAVSIDFDIIRDWIQHCGREHTKQCTQVESSASSLQELKLIDCEQRRIVPALPTYEYSALSYVWGTSRSGDDGCVHNELPTTLPRTIEDALKVSKLLGLRYIWIDRYCIDQDNDDEKRLQIQQMDLIYQNAFITIIAAAGADPYFGLPGVGATPRIPQPKAWIGGRCLVSTLTDPRTLIKASKWMHRAWTYQESFFSARRIVFTEQQVYYECRTGFAYETVENPNDWWTGIFDDQKRDEKRSPWDICSRLTDFCGRELSASSDAIRAFQGVFHSFRKKKFPVHEYLGIPIMPSKPEGWEGYHDLKICGNGEAFAAGLSWCNTASGTRRFLFPTWSWAGWNVPINYETLACRQGLQLESERPLKIFIENYDGSLSDMDEQSDVSLDMGIPGSSSKFIHIEAWTIPIDIQYLSDDEMGDWKKSREAHRYDGNYSGYFATFQDDQRTLRLPLYLLHQQYDKVFPTQQSYVPDLQQGSLLGIVLGRCEILPSDDVRDDIFVMIVHKREHHYERVGHMLIRYLSYRWLADKGDSAFATPWPLCFRLKERRTIRLG